VPIDSNAFNALLSGNIVGLERPDAQGQPLPAPPRETRAVAHAFGAFEGTFHAKVVDENSRINVQALDALGNTPLAVLTQLRAMMADPKYDFIFDEEDANRDRVRRDDVILAMKDWIDIDETGTALDPTNPQRPFVNGFGDENSAYSRYEPRYKAKNGRFDSLEELFMVRGVNDRFMAAFGDRLTVWPDINSKLNVNTDDPQQMLTNILIAAANPNDPALRDPRLLQTILQEIQIRKMFSFFGLSAQDFVAILQANAIRLRPEINPAQGGNATNLFGSTSDTFRITATGRVGRIEKQLTAVVRYDDGLGKMLYWKED
jgi:general secretion pathway protein K